MLPPGSGCYPGLLGVAGGTPQVSAESGGVKRTGFIALFLGPIAFIAPVSLDSNAENADERVEIRLY